jgi:hypothetical protein
MLKILIIEIYCLKIRIILLSKKNYFNFGMDKSNKERKK